VPLSFYWKNGKVKVNLAAGKGKAFHDKRDDLKKKSAERDMKRALMTRTKGR
jgi:SsrA-binding protein